MADITRGVVCLLCCKRQNNESQAHNKNGARLGYLLDPQALSKKKKSINL
jgi:hypothetical protein